MCIGKNNWFLIGDFINVIKAQIRIGGKLFTDSEHADLNNMIEKTSLFEMDSVGDYYTWSNNQTDEIIYSRIDRVLGNVSWIQGNLETTLEILSPSVSDHIILCL